MKLLITLGLTLILIIMAILGYESYAQSNMALRVANELAADLNLTRLNAISTGEQAVLCPIQTNAAHCGDQAHWINGWIFYTDVEHPTKETSNPLRVNRLDDLSGITMKGNTDKVAYNTVGVLSSMPLSVVIRPYFCIGSQVRIVSVSTSGRVNIESSGC